MVVAVAARADDAPRYALGPGVLTVETKDGAETIDLPCDQVYANVRVHDSLFVACGTQGVAVFDVHDRAHPSFYTRIPYDRVCARLTAEGDCVSPPPPPPPPLSPRRDPPPNTTRSLAVMVVVVAGALVFGGLTVELVQAMEDGVRCPVVLFGPDTCVPSPGPPAAVGFIGLGLIVAGAGLAVASIPIFTASRKRVTAMITTTGATVRLSF